MQHGSAVPAARREVDVLVVGSGAAGLATAVTAAHHRMAVLVAEKAPVCGGATSWSGGWIWAPGNRFAKAEGVVEGPEEFRHYLRACLKEHYNPSRVEAFLQASPEMVEFFHANTYLQFVPGTHIKDIYGKLPGAGEGHRSVAPKPIDARVFDKNLLSIMRRQYYETSFLGMGIMAGEDLKAFLNAGRGDIHALAHCARRVARHGWDLVTRGRSMQLVNGTALVGRLMKSATDCGVQFLTSSPAVRLVREGERIVGAVLDTAHGQVEVRARKGVVLASGGFPNNVELRKRYFPRTPTGQEHWTLAPRSSEGDGLSLAESAGGHLKADLASPAAWCPVSLVRYRNGRTGVFPHIMDRAKPGHIAVLRDGRRFVNEADGYHDYVTGMLSSIPAGHSMESWLICDHRSLRRYSLGMAKPWPVPILPHLLSGYLVRGKTVAALADKCGIDPKGLQATIIEFNADARNGTDPLLHRGETSFNRYGGDSSIPYPNPTLAPLEQAPFYAVRIVPGSFGTFAGIETDHRARVIRQDGTPVSGLYAVGSDQASVMGGTYPAGGINLGPAMTFGYIAGLELSGQT